MKIIWINLKKLHIIAENINCIKKTGAHKCHKVETVWKNDKIL